LLPTAFTSFIIWLITGVKNGFCSTSSLSFSLAWITVACDAHGAQLVGGALARALEGGHVRGDHIAKRVSKQTGP
jgi:hypothetical protein